MSTVQFSIAVKPAVALAKFQGSSARLVALPKFIVNGAITPNCQTGSATVDSIDLPDDETPFDKIANGTYRLPNRCFAVAPYRGETRIGAIQLTVQNVAIEVQVDVQRNLNSLLTRGAKGPAGIPLATPQYRIRARSVIVYDWSIVNEDQVYQGGWSWSGTSSGGYGNTREEGPWGDVLFLLGTDCQPIEPPVGSQYNQFTTVEIGKFLKTATSPSWMNMAPTVSYEPPPSQDEPPTAFNGPSPTPVGNPS